MTWSSSPARNNGFHGLRFRSDEAAAGLSSWLERIKWNGRVLYERRQILADQGKSWREARQTWAVTRKKIRVTVWYLVRPAFLSP